MTNALDRLTASLSKMDDLKIQLERSITIQEMWTKDEDPFERGRVSTQWKVSNGGRKAVFYIIIRDENGDTIDSMEFERRDVPSILRDPRVEALTNK